MASVWLGAWETWAPGSLAFLGVLGPGLLAAGRVRPPFARALALVALALLLVLTVVSFFAGVPTGALFDLVLAGALVALGGLGVRRAFAWALLAASALAVAKAFALTATAFAVPALLAPALTGALGWGAAAMLAFTLALIRLRRRSIPG